VDLPKAAAENIDPKLKEPIIVSVDAQGMYYLNIAADPNRAITSDILQSLVNNSLQQSNAAHQKRQVLVKGDKNVNYGKVVTAMVLLQHAGAESVGLITNPEPDANHESGTI
jgi:biopolymer transport protein TolR